MTRASARWLTATLQICSLGVVACGSPPPPAAPAPVKKPVRIPVEDSEPDDGLQVTSDKGHLDAKKVEAALAPHRSAMTRCYTERVARRSWLGGRVVLHWDVAADGAASVWIAESDLGAWPVESCLLDVARQVELGAPIGGPAELMLPLDLSTSRPLEAANDARGAKAAELIGKLDACGKPPPGSRAPKPKIVIVIPDDVTLTVYLGAHQVESVGFASPAGAIDEAWASCAEKAALAWRVPDPTAQVTKLLVRYRPR